MGESKRWIVTYTKHLRQKRKVYQDGIIEFHGPSNKVLLYDDDQKLLAARILKKDEVIESGATLAFETLLVDVGELDSTFKALQDMNASINRGKSRVKVERVQKSEGAFLVKKRHQEAGRLPNVCDNPVKVTEREWDVLYTSQVTQKAKRYHDGILKLVTSGSYMAQVYQPLKLFLAITRKESNWSWGGHGHWKAYCPFGERCGETKHEEREQLILLKEDGSTLTSKFHKSSECLIIGNFYELPNYLVEICGQRNVPEDSPKLKSGTSEQNGNLSSSLKTSLAGSDDKILRRQASSEAAMFTKVEVPVNKPRDAVQILSVLRRPREETIPRDSSSPSRNLILSSPRHSIVPECEEEIPQGSFPAFLAAVCEEDSCKIAVPDHEIKCVAQDTLNLEVSQEGPATLIPENISCGFLTAKESLGSQAKGILELESGLLNEESGLHVDILGFPKQLMDSDKISSEESKERGETSSGFPSFDLGF